MWLTPWFKELADEKKAEHQGLVAPFEVLFQQCMHGGSTPAWTKWLTNMPQFSKLMAKCDGEHEHKPWGGDMVNGKWVWRTAAHAEYPEELCSKNTEAEQCARAQPVDSSPKKPVDEANGGSNGIPPAAFDRSHQLGNTLLGCPVPATLGPRASALSQSIPVNEAVAIRQSGDRMLMPLGQLQSTSVSAETSMTSLFCR